MYFIKTLSDYKQFACIHIFIKTKKKTYVLVYMYVYTATHASVWQLQKKVHFIQIKSLNCQLLASELLKRLKINVSILVKNYRIFIFTYVQMYIQHIMPSTDVYTYT